MSPRIVRKKLAPFILFGAVFTIVVFAIVLLTLIGLRYDVLELKSFSLENWLLVTTAVGAPLVVWSLSSYIAVRNQVRQHSITILLETRVSEYYTERNRRVFEILKDEVSLSDLQGDDLRSAKRDITYSLNFFEFVAIGIKRGDLDEAIFKDAWKVLVCRMVSCFQPVINEAQAENPAIFENLVWLNNRWQKPEFSFRAWLDKLPTENKPPCAC